ncbi:MAG TPA: hypothetical protein VH643_15560 [Gemmataceae bacterium]|jgi:hypothetical protein
MLVKYWQAALLAALVSLSAIAARAQETCPKDGFATGYAPPAVSLPAKHCDAKASCESGDCCKDKDCCAKCVCGKDKGNCKCGDGCKGCACCKGKDSCKNCECGKSKACDKDCECCKESGKCCCAAKGKQTKKAVIHGAIVVHVPVPMMPVGGPYPIASPYGIPPTPPMSGPLATPLPPPPPMLTPPGVPVPTLTSPAMPPQSVALPSPPMGCYSGGWASPGCAAPPNAPMACCPITAGPVCATPSNAGPNLENCLSILSAVGELCSAYVHPSNLPVTCLSSLGMLMDLCPLTTAPVTTLPSGQYLQHPPQYIPPSPPFPSSRELAAQEASTATLLPPPRPECPACPTANPSQPCPIPQVTPPGLPAMPCTGTSAPTAPLDVPVLVADLTPARAKRVRITANPNSDQLEIASPTLDLVSCKKMVVRVGVSEIKVTCLDGQVRVRGEELKAKADCVCPDRLGGLVLEGDVVLSYKKNGQSTRVIADHVELNLANGTVTVKSAGKSSCKPIRYDRIDEGR